MRTEFTINPHTGEMMVRRADKTLLTRLQSYVGPGQDLECGQSRRCTYASYGPGSVRIASIVHGSMLDGPGLRSVAYFQGCPRRCHGCLSEHTHSFAGGFGASVREVVADLLQKDIPRDGVTLSGGDPFAQPKACAEIVAHLKHSSVHVIAYTGFVYEQLLHAKNPAIGDVLALADVLVDGPFVAALRDESLAYRGSSNQRVIDLANTRKTGKLCLLDWD